MESAREPEKELKERQVSSTTADGVTELLKQVLAREHTSSGWGRCRSWTWLIIMMWTAVLHGRAFIQFTSVQAGSINAVKNYNKEKFWEGRRNMFIVILKLVLYSSIQGLAADKFKNIWRHASTTSLISVYLGDSSIYYHAKLTGSLANPEHRLTSDVRSVVDDVTDMMKLLPEHLTNVVGLTGIMWKTSRTACCILWSYVLMATLASRMYFEHHSSRLELAVQVSAAHVRFALQRLQDSAEAIAFYAATGAEKRYLGKIVSQLAVNENKLLEMICVFGGVERLFSWVASILPSVIMAPRFWNGLNEFADYSLMVNGFRKVKDALFFFADNYDKLASISARISRVEELRCYSKTDTSGGKISLTGPPQAALLEVRDVSINVPSSMWGSGTLLCPFGVSVTLHPGDALLIQGESGAGKSSLLRVIAGIWNEGSGTVARVNSNQIFFLPQTPYLLTGDMSSATALRSQLSYPHLNVADNSTLFAALAVVKLDHLSDQLDAQKDWDTMLSGGEKQRLVFSRLLVQLELQVCDAPVVLLDEATAACSEQAEEDMYNALLQRIRSKNGAVVSIGHRSSLHRFHTQFLTL